MILKHSSIALFLIILSALAIIQTHAFRFKLTPDEPQISLFFDVNGKQTFYAVSSGEEVHDVQIIIEYWRAGAASSQPLIMKNTNDIQYTHNYDEGHINITIVTTNGGNRDVSFDFYNEDDPLVKMIDKRDIKYVEGVLSSVFKGLTTISRNQQFHIERDQSHKATLQESESHIKWTGIIKIIFLLSSALIQLWIMKGFFKNNTNNTYQPVQTSS